jgi:hypothetical protein
MSSPSLWQRQYWRAAFTRRVHFDPIMAPKRYKYEDDEDPNEVEEEDQWEWTDGIADTPPPPKSRDRLPPPTQHKSVYRRDNGSYTIGDVVQLETETAYKWVGLIRGLETDYLYKRGLRKRAIVIWFNRQQDVMMKHRRPGARAVRH